MGAWCVVRRTRAWCFHSEGAHGEACRAPDTGAGASVDSSEPSRPNSGVPSGALDSALPGECISVPIGGVVARARLRRSGASPLHSTRGGSKSDPCANSGAGSGGPVDWEHPGVTLACPSRAYEPSRTRVEVSTNRSERTPVTGRTPSRELLMPTRCATPPHV
jgi:hypothetical protein